jgi:phosphoribosylformylglycinamidine cyclo-ligase
MPGFYQQGHFDAAGFAVGIVNRSKLIDGSAIKAGDIISALPSSGLHSNGYSLVRKLIADGLVNLREQAPGEASGVSWGEALVRPTRLYVNEANRARQLTTINGMAHITGGGLSNIDRILPKGLGTRITTENLRPTAYMNELVRRASMEPTEARLVWNMGTGFVFVTPANSVPKLQSEFADLFVIGDVVSKN